MRYSNPFLPLVSVVSAEMLFSLICFEICAGLSIWVINWLSSCWFTALYASKETIWRIAIRPAGKQISIKAADTGTGIAQPKAGPP